MLKLASWFLLTRLTFICIISSLEKWFEIFIDIVSEDEEECVLAERIVNDHVDNQRYIFDNCHCWTIIVLLL